MDAQIASIAYLLGEWMIDSCADSSNGCIGSLAGVAPWKPAKQSAMVGYYISGEVQDYYIIYTGHAYVLY